MKDRNVTIMDVESDARHLYELLNAIVEEENRTSERIDALLWIARDLASAVARDADLLQTNRGAEQ